MLRPRRSIKMHHVLGLNAVLLQSLCKTKWLLKLGWRWHYVHSNMKIAKSLITGKPSSTDWSSTICHQIYLSKVCRKWGDSDIDGLYVYLFWICVYNLTINGKPSSTDCSSSICHRIYPSKFIENEQIVTGKEQIE